MALKFGKTWWGEHWLCSLENVDYDNRLPRGMSYARRGNVLSVKIKENTIKSKVAGSRKTPYTVTVIVPSFFEKDIERLMQKIIEKPVLISKLLNRELDPAILTIAEELGLKVFPKQWTDLKMQCSCPDWAVPCKHLASVIYMVSREIDNNPFLVFEIHNVDLIEELKKRGIFIADQKKNEILKIQSLISLKKGRKQTDYNEEKAYSRIDFSRLNELSEPLIQLLPDAPPFYSKGNFREKYATQLLRIGKQAKRLLQKNPDFQTVLPLHKSENIISHHTKINLVIDKDNQVKVLGKHTSLDSVKEVLPAVFQLPPDYLLDYQPSVVAIHKLLFAAIHLISNGNIVPQIVQLSTKDFQIRWLPAMIDEQVRILVEKFDEIIPPNLLQFKQITPNQVIFKNIENQSFELISIIVTILINALAKSVDNDEFQQMFFKGETHRFDGVGETALSGGIKVWLDRYYLTTETYKPQITITELDDEFDVSINVEDTSKTDVLPIPLTTILKEKQFEDTRFKILQSVSLLSPFIRGLDTHINLTGTQPIRFNIDDFAPFLMEILPAIRLLDIRILLPKSLQNLLRPKPSVKLKRNSEQEGFVRLDDLLSFDWQVALGDIQLSPEEFKKLLNNASGLFRFKENYIYVSDEEIKRLHKVFTTSKPLNSHQLLQAALSEEYEGSPISLTDEVRDLIAEMTSNKNISLPKGLQAILRPYQERGYSWMYRNSRIGFGSIIADDMGLGKTIQVIAFLLKFKEEGAINEKHKALVIVPTGLLTNWQSEIEKFAPSLSSHIHHGTGRDIKNFTADIMLTTYGVLRSDSQLLRKQKWQVMVIDEAQNIKNYSTNQSKAVKSIPANIRIAMSGTPVENRLTEFWSIMDYANKGYLGNLKSFKDNYSSPIQVFNDEKVVQKFRKITSPFMMRRMKTDKTIISDLPDKVEQNQFALLTKQQAALYEKTMHVAMEEIEGVDTGSSQKLFKRQGLVLQMILALKQICNHPTNFLKNANYDASISGKVVLLLELLDGIISSGEKALIFTQFTEMGTMLKRFIAERFNDSPMFYHGGSSVEQRQEMVDRFQNNRADKIFILSLKAAGTGLNLTAASHVIHFDLWWNPAVENQATDRAYRIGQKRNVMVHRFITKNTFEEKIDEMIQLKKHLADMTVATGENWIGKLSNKELREIFE